MKHTNKLANLTLTSIYIIIAALSFACNKSPSTASNLTIQSAEEAKSNTIPQQQPMAASSPEPYDPEKIDIQNANVIPNDNVVEQDEQNDNALEQDEQTDDFSKLGDIYFEKGDLTKARNYYRQGIRVQRHISDKEALTQRMKQDKRALDMAMNNQNVGCEEARDNAQANVLLICMSLHDMLFSAFQGIYKDADPELAYMYGVMIDRYETCREYGWDAKIALEYAVKAKIEGAQCFLDNAKSEHSETHQRKDCPESRWNHFDETAPWTACGTTFDEEIQRVRDQKAKDEAETQRLQAELKKVDQQIEERVKKGEEIDYENEVDYDDDPLNYEERRIEHLLEQLEQSQEANDKQLKQLQALHDQK